MLNASLGTGRQELEPQWSIPILVSQDGGGLLVAQGGGHLLVRFITWRLLPDHTGPWTCWSLMGFVIPNGNLLNLTGSVFLHPELRMTHAFQRKPTLFLELCSSVIVHLPTLPLPSHTWFVTASLYVLLFSCSTSTIHFLCLGEVAQSPFLLENVIFRLMSAEEFVFVRISIHNAMISLFLLFFFFFLGKYV